MTRPVAEIFIVISISRPGVHTRALIDFKMITMMTGAVISDDRPTEFFFLFFIIACFILRFHSRGCFSCTFLRCLRTFSHARTSTMYFMLYLGSSTHPRTAPHRVPRGKSIFQKLYSPTCLVDCKHKTNKQTHMYTHV